MTPRERHARMRAMVDAHLRFVARTLQKAGVPQSDLDDEIQRTFIAVASRLDDVHPDAERNFLYQVAVNMASHARRNLARRREVCTDELPERIHVSATPEHLTERKQLRKLLDDILGGMSEPLRSVFTLYEIEEMNAREIAAHLGIACGTVASRLRRARQQLRRHTKAIELAADLGTEGTGRIAGPTLLRRKAVGPLGRALLDAGAWTPMSGSMHSKTLAALGVLLAGSSQGPGVTSAASRA